MRAGSTQPTAAEVAARLEDCRWMAETGECLTGAARRLGLAHKTLEKWLGVNDPECLSTLLAHQPRDHNRWVMDERRKRRKPPAREQKAA